MQLIARSVQLIRTAEELELSYQAVFCCKLGKLKSLQGTELLVVVVICLLGSF